jgi:hypothetical protein
MAPDERDRSFDKALARHLRSAAPIGESAGRPEGPSSRSPSCPDAETLAAYHERSLFPEQLNSWKEHIVGCSHCQTILAHLEATDEIPLPAFAQEEAAMQGSERVSVAPSQSQTAASAVAPAKSRRVLHLRGARWPWLAPAGALAAGLLVWIALHENRPSVTPSLKQVEVAANHVPPAPPASSSKPSQEVSPVAKAATPKPLTAADELSIARANARSEAAATKPSSKQDYLAQVSPSKTLADKEGRLRKDAAPGTSADLLRAERELDRDDKPAAGAGQRSVEEQLQQQAANAQLQNQTNANAPKVPGPAPLGQTDNKKKETKAARAAALEPPAAPVAGLTAVTSMSEVVAVSNPGLIAPPGSSFIWRAGRVGLIEFSKDGGSSWSRQTSGVLVDLLTGSAPSSDVCWIVGRLGAILLTTDGGAHWKLVKSPLSEDLGGVRASDALHATIWNARANRTFQTSDGGFTWTTVPSP